MSHLPQPNSIGSAAHGPSKGGNLHPLNAANLPRPNSIGSAAAHKVGNGGSSHPLSAANLPRPNSIGSAAHLPGKSGSSHALNLAKLPRPNSIGSGVTHPGNGTNQPNLHALTATHQGAGNPAASGHAHSDEPGNITAVAKDGKLVGLLDAQLQLDAHGLGQKAVNLDISSDQLNAAVQTLKDKTSAESQAANAAAQAADALQKAQQNNNTLTRPLLVSEAQTKLTEANANLSLASAAANQARNSAVGAKVNFLAATGTQQSAAVKFDADQKRLADAKATLATAVATAGGKTTTPTGTGAGGGGGTAGTTTPTGAGDGGGGAVATTTATDIGTGAGGGGSGTIGPIVVAPVLIGPGPVVAIDPAPAIVDPGPGVVETAPVVAGLAPAGDEPPPVRRRRAAAPAPIAESVARVQRPIIPLPVPAPVVTAVQDPPADAPVDDAAATDPEFVSVVFQADVSDADKAAFLDAYKVTIVDGPNADGFVKLKLNEPVPADQLPVFIDSMKQQTAIVSNAVPG